MTSEWRMENGKTVEVDSRAIIIRRDGLKPLGRYGGG